jgi:general L-amino acid transport system substrate-binding protein
MSKRFQITGRTVTPLQRQLRIGLRGSESFRQGEQWANIVKWTVFALINAEELGISSASIDQAVRSRKPEVMRLVGSEGNFGEQAGLTRDWAVRIVRSVGNCGETFERDVGVESKLGIPRGLNQLWSNGGILFAPPIR